MFPLFRARLAAHPIARLVGILASLLALAVGLLFASLLGAGPAAAQSAATGPRRVAYVILRGDDTLAVERVERWPDRASATIHLADQPWITLDFRFTPEHTVSETRFQVRLAGAPSDATPAQDGTVRFVGDSALLTMKAAGQERALRVATTAGALPLANNELLVVEQAVRIARARRVTTLRVPLFLLSGARTIDASLELRGADSARFTILSNVTDYRVDADGYVLGGVIAAAGLRIAVVTGPAMAGISIGRPNYDAPAGATYLAEHVVVPTPAGHRLAGTLTKPRDATGRLPAVVTITGSGQQDRDAYLPIAGGVRIFRQVADTLSRRGIAVLRLDDRAIGGSGGDPTGTSADFADDIRASVAYLRSRPDIDPARIALVGHSEGGMIAPMIAATDPSLAAIVLMAGTGYTGRKIIDYQIENGARGMPGLTRAQQDSIIADGTRELEREIEKNAWMRFFVSYDPIPTARRVRQPTLILQGATDQQVRPEEARLLDAAIRGAGNTRVTLRILPERNHLFLRDANGHPAGYAALKDPRVDGEVLGVLADWLAQALGAR